MDESAHFAGLDIGGTTVKAALLNGTGRQIGEGVELRSHGSDGYKATFKQLHLILILSITYFIPFTIIFTLLVYPFSSNKYLLIEETFDSTSDSLSIFFRSSSAILSISS